MAYACQYDFVGLPPINWGYAPDTTQRAQLGIVVSASDPFWGGGEFIYGKNNTAGAMATGVLAVFDNAYNFVGVPNAANQSRAVAATWQNFTAQGQFGWFQLAGQAPISATASVAAGTPFGITGVGTVGASSAGKEIEGTASGTASTQTVVKSNVNTLNLSPVIQVGNSDGWFPGIALSGTGIPGGTTLSSVDPSGRFVTMSANATATGTVSVTGTYTNFIISSGGRMFAQGRIT